MKNAPSRQDYPNRILSRGDIVRRGGFSTSLSRHGTAGQPVRYRRSPLNAMLVNFGRKLPIERADDGLPRKRSRCHIPVAIPRPTSPEFPTTRPCIRDPKEFSMIGLVRAAMLSAVLAIGLACSLVPTSAADKAFKRDDLADSAIKLEAQIKSEAGAVVKSVAALRNDADAALRRNDVRGALQVLGQVAATAPEDSANWL